MKLISKSLILLFTISLTNCSSDDSSNSGFPTDRNIFNITLDGTSYEMKAGYDFNGEDNCYIISDLISFTEDYNTIEIILNPLNVDIITAGTIFPYIDLLLPSGELQVGNLTSGSQLINMNIETSDLNLSYYYADNPPEISITDYNISISEFQRNVNGDVDILKGSFASKFVTLADQEAHQINIDFDIKSDTIGELYTEPIGTLVGTWYNLNGCMTADNGQAYFQFNTDGSGRIFNADCNSTCTGYGYFLNFNWVDNGTSVTLNYTSVSEYCGAQVSTPSPETLNYSISGNELSIGGATWTKN